MNKCRVCQQINNNLIVINNDNIKLYLAQSIINLKGYKDTLEYLTVCENCKQGLESLATFWLSIPEANQGESTESLEFVNEIENIQESFIWNEENPDNSQQNLEDLTLSTTDLIEQTKPKNEMNYEPIKLRIKLPPKRKRKKSVPANENIAHNDVDTKRSRRLPKRYKDFKLNYRIKTKENENLCKDNVDNSKENSLENLPVMALIRFSSNISVIGKLLEVESNGFSSRIRIICEICFKVFRFEKDFRIHFKNHDFLSINQSLDDESYLYYCSLCDKSFSEHIAVRRHYRLSHSEDRTLKCQHCDASFKYKFNLDYHMAKHIPKKRFECVFCKKSFLYRYELQIHLRTHTKEKPFKCELCSWAFAHRSNLKAHQKNKHFENSTNDTSSKEAVLVEETLPSKENLDEIKDANFNSNKQVQILLDNTNSSSEISFPNNFQDFSSHLKDLDTTELTTDSNYEPLTSSVFENEVENMESYDNNDNSNQTFSNAVERFKAPGSFTKFHIDESILKVLNSSDLLGLKKWPKNYQNTMITKETNNSISYQKKTTNSMELDIKRQKLENQTNNDDKTKDLDEKIGCVVKFKHLTTNSFTTLNKNSTLITNTSNSSSFNTDSLSSNSKTAYNFKSHNSDNKKSTNFQVPSSSILTKDSKFMNITKLSNFNSSPLDVKHLGNVKQIQIIDKNDTFFKEPTAASPPQHLASVKQISIIDKNDKVSKEPPVSSSSQANSIKVCNNSKTKNNSPSWNVIKVSPRPVKIINISNLNKFKKLETKNNNSNNQQHKAETSISSTSPNTKISKGFSPNLLVTSSIPKVSSKSSNSPKSLLKSVLKNPQISTLTSTNSKPIQANSYNKPLITNIEILPPLPTLQPLTKSSLSHDNLNSAPQQNEFNSVKDCQLSNRCIPQEKTPSDSRAITTTKSSRSYEITAPVSLEFNWQRNNIINQKFSPLENRAALPTNSSLNLPPENLIKPPAAYKYQCPHCFKYFKQKSPLTKHLRTHTGEKPYKCNLCPKSYADASNYKKHKILHKNAAEALNIARTSNSYAVATSPAYSTVSDPDPDGIEVMQTIKKFVNSSTDDEDDDDVAEEDLDDNCSLNSVTMDSSMWQDALENVLMNDDVRENIKRNLISINNAIMPKSMQQSSTNKGKLNEIFSSEDPD